MKVTVNCCRDFMRSRTFTERNNTVEYEDSLMGANVTSLLEKSVRRQEIREAIFTLPQEQRDAVILYFYSGFKIREIARITDTKETTVKSRLYQAINKLKKILSGGEYYAK